MIDTCKTKSAFGFSKMWTSLVASLNNGPSLFIPPICVHCHNRRWASTPLCLSCLKNLKPLRNTLCDQCGLDECVAEHGENEHPFTTTQFLFRMSPELSTLVHGFKYRNLRRHIPFLCTYLRFRPDLIARIQSCDGLVPVPIHPLRRRERGYNQSEILSMEIARLTGRPILSNILRRTKYTESQTKLAKTARSHNLETAFSCTSSSVITGKKLFLIDDVFTTGATASQCAGLLLKAGCASVDVFALAKVEWQPSQDDFSQELAKVFPVIGTSVLGPY